MTTTCDRCDAELTPSELGLGWPIEVVSTDGEHDESICPDCYGDEGHCVDCGGTLPAQEESTRCEECA